MQDVILQYGGACVHRARFVSDFLQQQQDTHITGQHVPLISRLWDSLDRATGRVMS